MISTTQSPTKSEISECPSENKSMMILTGSVGQVSGINFSKKVQKGYGNENIVAASKFYDLEAKFKEMKAENDKLKKDNFNLQNRLRNSMKK